MTHVSTPSHIFPAGLLEWAGHRSGGVRRLFDDASGRPSGAMIDTPLLHRLRGWATSFAEGRPNTPRIVLLVGGPGNGKTEAVESTVRQIEDALGVSGELQGALRPLFNPTDGSTVPRRVELDIGELATRPSQMVLTLVQDASVSDPAYPDLSAASLLVSDLEKTLQASEGNAFLACVNRGVLDDALIHAIEAGRDVVRQLLETIVRAAGMSPGAPSCWPLKGDPTVAIWPMDVESLLVPRSPLEHLPSPAAQVLSVATAQESWPELGSCVAGEKCPFCRSRHLLSGTPHGGSALQILRWYELATGKRWSFRDLFTLISFLLAGSPPEERTRAITPCEWAAGLLELETRDTARQERLKLAAPFLLLGSQYQHVLFGQWSVPASGGIRLALRELKLENPTLLGLHYFLSGARSISVPATLRAQLASLCDALDPALADPDAEVEVSARTVIHFRDLDSRFSRSVREGMQFIRKYQCLSPLEVDILSRLAAAEDALAAPEVRRRKPATSARLQMLVRDFACRMVRRTLGVRSAVVRHHSTLSDFERVVRGDEQLMHVAVKQVEGLLNDREKFAVPLNTTFGQPLPPESRQVVLTTAKQKVRPNKADDEGRPGSDVKLMSVGSGTSIQPIPLTYDLYKSVRELRSGMLAASLPRTVTALLDTTRARLAGRIVRDEEQLDGAEIRVGPRPETIVRELGTFLVRQEEADQ